MTEQPPSAALNAALALQAEFDELDLTAHQLALAFHRYAERVCEERGDGWRTIERAPRENGAPLLLWWPRWSRRAIIGWWMGDHWDSGHTLTYGEDMAGPTHWQPLPSPPTGRVELGERSNTESSPETTSADVWTEEDLRAADAEAEKLHRYFHPEQYAAAPHHAVVYYTAERAFAAGFDLGQSEARAERRAPAVASEHQAAPHQSAFDLAKRAREEVAANWRASFLDDPSVEYDVNPDLLAMIEQAALNAITRVASEHQADTKWWRDTAQKGTERERELIAETIAHQAALEFAEAKVVQLSETAGEDYSVGFDAATKALLARLREPDLRAALSAELRPYLHEMLTPEARDTALTAALARIGEMLTP